MIPKKIHYCWFGRGPKPKLALKCIDSWRKYCPDYEIIEWNEDNFDVNKSPYSKWCYENKKWAFLSDYARLVIVNEHGGFYFDTDVEIIRNLNDLLSYDAVYGFENDEYVATGLGFASVVNHYILNTMIMLYDNQEVDANGDYPPCSCPVFNTKAIEQFGLVRNGKMQMLGNTAVFPIEYFNPFENSTGRLRKTKNTYSVHWYAKSWISKHEVFRSKILRPIHRLFGDDCFKWIKKMFK